MSGLTGRGLCAKTTEFFRRHTALVGHVVENDLEYRIPWNVRFQFEQDLGSTEHGIEQRVVEPIQSSTVDMADPILVALHPCWL